MATQSTLINQIDSLYTILALKKLNLSLAEIKGYTNHRSPDRLIRLMEEKIDAAQKQLDDINKVKNYLKETINHTNRGLNYCEHFEIVFEEEESLLMAEKANENSDRNRKFQVEFEEATFSPDTSCIGTLVAINNPKKKRQIFLKLYGEKQQSNQVKKEGFYARKIHVGPHETIEATYEEMKREIQKKGYQVGKLAYEEYLIDDLATDNQEEYITLIKMEVF